MEFKFLKIEKWYLQSLLCKEYDIPFFAPMKCYSCYNNIYNYLSIQESALTHIVGCPICNRSFVD